MTVKGPTSGRVKYMVNPLLARSDSLLAKLSTQQNRHSTHLGAMSTTSWRVSGGSITLHCCCDQSIKCGAVVIDELVFDGELHSFLAGAQVHRLAAIQVSQGSFDF